MAVQMIKSPGGGSAKCVTKSTYLTAFSALTGKQDDGVKITVNRITGKVTYKIQKSSTQTTTGTIDFHAQSENRSCSYIAEYRPSRRYFKMRDRLVKKVKAPITYADIRNTRLFKEKYAREIVLPSFFLTLLQNMVIINGTISTRRPTATVARGSRPDIAK